MGKVAVPIALATLAAVGYAVVAVLRLPRGGAEPELPAGRAFDLRSALIFAALVTAISLVSRVAEDVFGTAGLIVTVAIAGFADVHVSVAGLVASGAVEPEDAVVPILVALTSNSITKLFLAASTGRGPFAARVGLGLVLLVGSAWVGYIATAS